MGGMVMQMDPMMDHRSGTTESSAGFGFSMGD